MSCGRECGCDNTLVHDVDQVIARIEAPIPPPTLRQVVTMLREALAHYEESQP